MKHMQYKTPRVFSLIVLICSQVAFIPMASAESSLLIELSEQLNQESQQVRNGLVQLKSGSPHQKYASEWAEKARSLPKDSKDFAHARAQYVHAVASDLEKKFDTVTNIYHAADAMTDTIDQLVEAQNRSEKNTKLLFRSNDSAETIQAKAKQLKGLNNMFISLINTDPSMQNAKLRQAYRVYQLQWQNTKLQASVPRGQGINSLQRLKESSESIAFLAKAYLNGLKQQVDIAQIISIGGEANLVIGQADEVLADGFEVLNPDGKAMTDMQMMLGSIEESQTAKVYHIGGNPEISNEIDAHANTLINQ